MCRLETKETGRRELVTIVNYAAGGFPCVPLLLQSILRGIAKERAPKG
jgi:hypothetical protein